RNLNKSCPSHLVLKLLSEQSHVEIKYETLSLCPDSTGTETCDDLCYSDSDCFNGKKCCYNGCGYDGRQCMAPVLMKPGLCGWLLFLPPCHDHCRDDSDCGGEKKCCQKGSGHSCEDPFFSFKLS
uniref:WAP domain-containing protein n=1 Tax=Kryptolebias marmoratus TaxID=37003 RepID=A0A3Q3ARW7_KRYMA